MQYRLMCCFDEKEKIMREYGAWVQSLVQLGQLRGEGQLCSTSSATTVRMKNGKPFLTDGPFAETKKQLGGYHLVDCKALDKTLAITARILTLPAGGAIEECPFESTHENHLSISG